MNSYREFQDDFDEYEHEHMFHTEERFKDLDDDEIEDIRKDEFERENYCAMMLERW